MASGPENRATPSRRTRRGRACSYSDAVDIVGPYVRNVHAKDGLWPKDPDKLGEEVIMGKGVVDFRTVFTKLHRIGYTGVLSIERETSGAQQIADVRQEKLFLERVQRELMA